MKAHTLDSGWPRTVAPAHRDTRQANRGLKFAYWIATGLLVALMVFSAVTYFVRHDRVEAVFVALGYPTYIIYPLAIAKLLGVVAIVSKRSATLKEWAYAGFFFDFVLALSAHLNAGDGQFGPALGALIVLVVS